MKINKPKIQPPLATRIFKVTIAGSMTQPLWTDVDSNTWSDLEVVLTEHIAGEKDGHCYAPAVFDGDRRKNAKARQIDLIVLDMDAGDSRGELERAIGTMGWRAIVHSTHSHLYTETKVKRKDYDEWMASHPDASEADYLIAEKGCRPSIAAGAKELGHDDKFVTIGHKPWPKWRVILCPDRPWLRSDYATQAEAEAAWRTTLHSVAAALGIGIDPACTDLARLYFFPRYPEGGPKPEYFVFEGAEVLISDLPSPASIDQAFAVLPLANVDGTKAGSLDFEGDTGRFEFTDSDGEPIDLNQWAAEYGSRFEIVTALKKRRPGAFVDRQSGQKHHIRCVNGAKHSEQEDDTATFIMNASNTDKDGFVYHCRHGHCDDLDRLRAVQLMLEQGSLTIADLMDEAFLVPLPTHDECIDLVMELSEDSTSDEINEALSFAAQANADPISMGRILDEIKSQTGTNLGDLKKGLSVASKTKSGEPDDTANRVAKKTLSRFYSNGKNLVRGKDRGFWHYNGKHWERHTDEQVQKRILSIVEKSVTPLTDSFAQVTRDALKLLIAKQAADGDVLRLKEDPPPVINCQNGELWISPDDGSVELRPHSRDSYLTYVLNVEYDPGATCPRFDQALLDTFANSSNPADMARHLVEFIGYVIQPTRHIPAWFMMLGKGRNGKTKLIETVEHLIDKRAVYSDRLANIESNRFAIGALAGKLMVVDDDVDTGTKLPDGLLKKISERKLLTGEHKFKDSFEFVSICLPVLLANNAPLSADLSWGLRRRAHIIPFDRVFTDEDGDDHLYPYIWTNELPGVLNRAIEGLQRLLQRGRFDQPADCIAAQDRWLAQANPLTAFIEERCEAGPSSNVPLAAFYKAFNEWAAECGIRSIPSRHTIKSNLENLGYSVRHRNTGNFVIGISVNGHYYSDN